MREVLSKRPKLQAKTKVTATIAKSKTRPAVRTKAPRTAKPVSILVPASKRAKVAPASSAKPVKKAAKASKTTGKPSKTLEKKAVAAKTKTAKVSPPKIKAKAPKVPKVKVAAQPKTSAKLPRQANLSAGKSIARTAANKTGTDRARSKVKLPRVVAPPPELPRRQVSSGVLRAFEHAVRVFNRRQYAEAKPLFESLQTKFPQEVEIIARAQTYIHVCEQKLAHAPSAPRNADELYDRGVYALNIGDFTQARAFFEKALRMKPDEPHLLYSLAATHAQTGAHDQALDYLYRTIQLQPRYRAQALNDSDFSGLRENKRFLELLGLASPFDRLEARR